ncbi:MAG: DUF47 domain-containing protein [Verrucomicrobiae bacterium]|nr:DUF47 domain-containing protein [Verrucomicrobiae bacterium]
MKIFKKEKDVVGLALGYLDVVDQCVRTAGQAVILYLNGDRPGAAALQPKVSELESQADEIRRCIGDKLYSGAYLPLMRGDIYSIIDSLDHVPNAAEACCNFFTSQTPDIPDDFVAAYLETSRASFGIITELSEVVTSFFKPKGKIDAIREHAKGVGTQESAVDGMEWETTVRIFECPTIDLAHKIHLKTALDRIGHISDRAEDAAEYIELVAMKSIL